MTQLFDKLKEAKKRLEDDIRNFGKEAFSEYLKDFFEQNPGVQKIQWTQYTPYFNDGDECVFRYYSAQVKLVGDKEYKDYYDIDDKNIKGNLITLNREFENMQEILLMAFGDHAQVTASRDKITVDRYDHE